MSSNEAGCFLMAADPIRLTATAGSAINQHLAFKYDPFAGPPCRIGGTAVPAFMKMEETADVWSELQFMRVPSNAIDTQDVIELGPIRNGDYVAIRSNYQKQFVSNIVGLGQAGDPVCATKLNREPNEVFKVMLSDPLERWSSTRILKDGDEITLFANSQVAGVANKRFVASAAVPAATNNKATFTPSSCNMFDSDCISQCQFNATCTSCSKCEYQEVAKFKLSIIESCTPISPAKPVLTYASIPFEQVSLCHARAFGALCGCSDMRKAIVNDADVIRPVVGTPNPSEADGGACYIPFVNALQPTIDMTLSSGKLCRGMDECEGLHPRYPQLTRDFFEASRFTQYQGTQLDNVAVGQLRTGHSVPIQLPNVNRSGLCMVANADMAQLPDPVYPHVGLLGQSCNRNLCRPGSAAGPYDGGAKSNFAFKHEMTICITSFESFQYQFTIGMDSSSWIAVVDGVVLIDKTHQDTYGPETFETQVLSHGLHTLQIYAVEDCCDGCAPSGWKQRMIQVTGPAANTTYGDWAPFSQASLSCDGDVVTTFGNTLPRQRPTCANPNALVDSSIWVSAAGRKCLWYAVEMSKVVIGEDGLMSHNPCDDADVVRNCPIACRRVSTQLLCSSYVEDPVVVFNKIERFSRSACLETSTTKAEVETAFPSIGAIVDDTCGFSYPAGVVTTFTLVAWVKGAPTIEVDAVPQGGCFAVDFSPETGKAVSYFFDLSRGLTTAIELTVDVSPDRWHFVGVGWNSTHAFMFVDGIYKALLVPEFSCPGVDVMQFHEVSTSRLHFYSQALSTADLQRSFYDGYPQWIGSGESVLLQGPRLPVQQTVADQDVDFRNFREHLYGIIPPIIFQERLSQSPVNTCEESSPRRTALVEMYKRQLGKFCRDSVLDCPSIQIPCYDWSGDRVEDGTHMMRGPVKFRGKSVFTEFLYALDTGVLVRDGKELQSADFVDRATSRVTVVNMFWMDGIEDEVVGLMQVVFDLSPPVVSASTTFTFFSPLKHSGKRFIVTVVFWSIAALCLLILILTSLAKFSAVVSTRGRMRLMPTLSFLLVMGAYLTFWLITAIRSEDCINDMIDHLTGIEWENDQVSFEDKAASLFKALDKVLDLSTQDFIFQTISYFMGMACLVRIVPLMEMHPRTALFSGTVRRSFDDMLHFVVYAGAMFMALVMIAYFVFGSTVEGFHDIGVSVDQLWKMLNQQAEESSNGGPLLSLFRVLFTFLFVYFLLNFLLAIIVDAYAAQKSEADECPVVFSVWKDVALLIETWMLSKKNAWPKRHVLLKQLHLGSGRDKVQTTRSMQFYKFAPFPDKASCLTFAAFYHSMLESIEDPEEKEHHHHGYLPSSAHHHPAPVAEAPKQKPAVTPATVPAVAAPVVTPFVPQPVAFNNWRNGVGVQQQPPPPQQQQQQQQQQHVPTMLSPPAPRFFGSSSAAAGEIPAQALQPVGSSAVVAPGQIDPQFSSSMVLMEPTAPNAVPLPAAADHRSQWAVLNTPQQ